MPRRGENIYKRKDGRYEGRYVIGRTGNGRTRFGYVYGYQYSSVRSRLLQKKAQLLNNQGADDPPGMTVQRWMTQWLEGVHWAQQRQNHAGSVRPQPDGSAMAGHGKARRGVISRQSRLVSSFCVENERVCGDREFRKYTTQKRLLLLCFFCQYCLHH